MNRLSVLDPSAIKPSGYRVVVVSGNTREPFPLRFGTHANALAFIKHIKKFRRPLEMEVEAILPSTFYKRVHNVNGLIPLVRRIAPRIYSVPSRSEPGTYHRVRPDQHGELYCSCTAGLSRSVCDHLLAVLSLEEDQKRRAA